jgi:cell wall-associated NlpC family hydrolase
VKGQKLQPGDIVLPHKGHVVMYVGGGKVIAAPYTGTVVQYQPVPKNPLEVRRVL